MTKGLIAVTVIIVLFFFPIPKYLVALVAAGILLCSHKLESKDVLKLVDWQLLILFISLFVVVGAFSYSGLGFALIEYMKKLGIHLNNSYTLAVTAGVLSNLINNSAAVMFLVHIIDLTKEVNCYILAMANTFAGNFLLIGSVANLIVAKEAKDLNINISFMQFAKYGIPSAVISFIVLLSWIFIMAR
jgi:Na+/H+ antiporter NhaD/arsenite permease-like protein